MSLVRVLTRPHVGMGAMPLSRFTDTGDGITPDNFASRCCSPGLIWGKNFAYSDDTCVSFVNANLGLFGAEHDWCSDAALANLGTPLLVPTMATVPPPKIDADPESPTYGQAINPCTNQPVVTQQDAIDMQTCLATLQAAAQAKAVKESAGVLASAQCAAMKVKCANETWASFLKPSADCSACEFSWSNPASVFLVGGGILLGLVLVKAITR